MAREKFGISTVFKDEKGDKIDPAGTEKVPAPPRFERKPITPELARELDENTDRLFPNASQLRGGQGREDIPAQEPAKPSYEFPELPEESDSGLVQPQRRKRGQKKIGNTFIRGPEEVIKRFEDFVAAGDFAAKWDALEYLLNFHDMNIKKSR